MYRRQKVDDKRENVFLNHAVSLILSVFEYNPPPPPRRIFEYLELGVRSKDSRILQGLRSKDPKFKDPAGGKIKRIKDSKNCAAGWDQEKS